MDKNTIVEEFDKRITLCEENLRFLKGLLEVIESLNKSEESILIFEENAFIKKIKEESLNGSFDKIISICSLSRISKIELYIISKHLILSKYSWEKFYFLRVAILNIYETINAYQKSTKELKSISENKHHLPISFVELGKKMREFKKKNNFETQMNNIRNSTIGHISLDFNKYYDDVKSIDKQRTIQMIKNFISILDEIHDFSLHCLLSKPMEKKIEIDETYDNLKLIFDKNNR